MAALRCPAPVAVARRTSGACSGEFRWTNSFRLYHAKIARMSQEQKTETKDATPKPVIHRVCIQCNNMFQVTPDRIDAKQCPNCHKG